MPYYRCPACGLTVHSVAGRLVANVCPNCSAPLASGDRIDVEERRPASFSRVLPAERGAAATARRELETLLWSLDANEHEVVALLLTELIANGVVHSDGDGQLLVEVDVSAARVHVEVGDGGSGFEVDRRSPRSPLDSHWGLHLVEHLADRWAVRARPHTRVWFELDRPRPSSAVPSNAIPA
jgi:anti-sigma regulatory factor (Ser/Thr protein kinase)